MKTRPSAAVVSANHFLVASLALLLTHQVPPHLTTPSPHPRRILGSVGVLTRPAGCAEARLARALG
jgi:hypothetical protein